MGKPKPKTKTAQLILRLLKTASKKEKLEILADLYADEIAFNVFYHALNPYWTYGVQPAKVVEIKTASQAKHIDEALQFQWPKMKELLERLATRQLTGMAAKKAAANFGDAAPIMQRILKKDLRCGVHAKTINERYSGFIPTFEVALADEGLVIVDGQIVQGRELLQFPMWAEPKYDGIRTLAIIDMTEGIQLFSRYGREFENYPNITQVLAQHEPFAGLVLDGEVFGATFDDVAEVAHTKDGRDDAKLSYCVWDCMKVDEFRSQGCKRPLWERQKMLAEAMVGCPARVSQTPGCLVQDHEPLLTLFKQMRDSGYEGLILKPLDSMYSYKRSKDWIKVKEMFTDEFKVVGFNVGKGKYSKTLGALVISVGKVNVEVGSGFTDADRKDIWQNRKDYLGRVVEVKYQEKTKLKADGTGGSLRFPTFLRWRPDVNC